MFKYNFKDNENDARTNYWPFRCFIHNRSMFHKISDFIVRAEYGIIVKFHLVYKANLRESINFYSCWKDQKAYRSKMWRRSLKHWNNGTLTGKSKRVNKVSSLFEISFRKLEEIFPGKFKRQETWNSWPFFQILIKN